MVDGLIRAGGLDEEDEGDDDWGSLGFEDREIERDSLGSPPSEDGAELGGRSEMSVRPTVCSPRRLAVVGRQAEEYFPQAVGRWSSRLRASINVVVLKSDPSYNLRDTRRLRQLKAPKR
jgi:hypothetical protein